MATKKTAAKRAAVKKKAPSESTLAAGPLLALPAGTSEEIEPTMLLLDPQNLRLLERVGEAYKSLDVKLFGQKAIQEKIFTVLNEEPRFDIKSLVASISNNGFLKHERLIVARYDGDKFLVLEGNRRLTAVRKIILDHGSNLSDLSNDVRGSLRTLPCFVLDGPVIAGSPKNLESYRRAAEIYIGMRHLMGAKNWEPASRYEFQSRLIFDEKWSIAQVAERFGRDKAEVLRDLKAHVLYQDFLRFEKVHNIGHSLTYNAFAEAARAPAISKWLGWSSSEMKYEGHESEAAFFHYLTNKLTLTSSKTTEDDEETPEVSTEMAVRRLRDMLRLDDSAIEEALIDRDFKSAEILFEERKEGTLSKKLNSFIRTLKRTPADELISSPEVKQKLEELATQVAKSLSVIAALVK